MNGRLHSIVAPLVLVVALAGAPAIAVIERPIAREAAKKKWQQRFRALPKTWREWAHRVSWCESRNENAHAGPHHSYFQWRLNTWQNYIVRGKGDPHTRTWAEQGWRAVRLARADGTHHWPRCG